MLQPKFKLSGSSVFSSGLSGGAIGPSGIPSVMPQLFIQYKTTWQNPNKHGKVKVNFTSKAKYFGENFDDKY